MRTLKINSIAILAIASAAFAASTASAGGFSFSTGGGGGGGNGKGNFKVNFNGNNQNNSNHNKNSNLHLACHSSHHPTHYVKKYYVRPVHVYDHCYHPQFRACFVYPGDTWFTICQRVYGCNHLWKHIATYNGLPFHAQLVPGQQLMLPVVNANGTLAASNAPMPMPFIPQGGPVGPIGPETAQFAPQGQTFARQGQAMAPQGLPMGLNAGSNVPQGQSLASLQGPINQLPTQNNQLSTPTTPVANSPISSEPTLPKFAIGSEMMISGQSLGEVKGTARLRIGEMALPLEVTLWDATGVKILLPKIDISRPIKAELEVLRADGTLAAKSTIELTPAAASLALGN